MAFQKASKKKARARIALLGTAGSGKTMTALRIAHALVPGGRIAVFDTERGSASKYAGERNPDGGRFAFDADDTMEDFDVRKYIGAVETAVAEGYDVLIIDSLSHAWAGKGGLLEFVDALNDKEKFGKGWRAATPLHNKLIDTILSANVHIIATMRTKTEYVLEDNGKGGKVPRKIGMQPVQRDGLEYEFDLILDLDGAQARVGKTRCSALAGKSFYEPGKDIADILRAWLEDGAEAPAKPTPTDDDAHDASWADDRARFCAALGELGFKYEDIKAWCLANKRPKPSAMTQARREQLYDYLKSEVGAAKLRDWLQTGMAAAK
jgi:hypothetical protein